MFRLTWTKPVPVGLRRNRWRRAAAATTLPVTTSCVCNTLPVLGRQVSRDNPAALGGGGFPQPVERAVHTSPATVANVRVDHRRLDVLVPQQPLDCSDDRHSRVELFTTPSLSEILVLGTGYGN